MGIDRNKDVVRRFITEVLSGGQLDRIDELVAPNYINRAFGADYPGTFGLRRSALSTWARFACATSSCARRGSTARTTTS